MDSPTPTTLLRSVNGSQFFGGLIRRSSNFFYNLTLIAFQKIFDKLIILFAFEITCSYVGIPISKRRSTQKYPAIEGKALRYKSSNGVLSKSYFTLYCIQDPKFLLGFWKIIPVESSRINNNIKICLKTIFSGVLYQIQS